MSGGQADGDILVRAQRQEFGKLKPQDEAVVGLQYIVGKVRPAQRRTALHRDELHIGALDEGHVADTPPDQIAVLQDCPLYTSRCV